MTLRPFSAVKSLLVASIALALVPAAASAQPRSRAASAPVSTGDSPALGAAIGAMDYSLLLGLDIPPSGFDVGPRISAEAMYGLLDLAPQLRLDVGGRASFAYHGGSFDTSLWVLDAVPDAKIRYAINDMFGVYGDLGLGLALIHVSTPSVVTPFGTVGGSDTSVALAFQIGGGATYAISPNLNLLGEIRLEIYTKSGSSTFVTVPTVGVQWH